MKREFLKAWRVGVVVLVVTVSIICIPWVAWSERSPLAGQSVIMAIWPLTTLEPIHEMIPEFERVTGASVTLDLMGEGALRERLVMEFAAKKVIHNVALLGSWVTAEQKDFYMDLSKFIKEKSAPIIPGLHNFDVNDIDPGFFNLFDLEGKIVAIPYYWESSGLHYRKDIFAELGLTPPDTHEELMTAAKKIAANRTDVYPIAMRAIRGEDSGLMSSGAAWMWGGTWFEGNPQTPTEIKRLKAKPSVNTQPWIDAFEFFADLLGNYGPPDVTHWTWTEVSKAFYGGRLAMDIDANYFVGFYNDPNVSEIAGKAGLALPPQGPAGQRHQHGFVAAIGIPNYAVDTEAAWEFIKWYTAKSTVKKGMIAGMRLNPCHPELLTSEEYVKTFGVMGKMMDATRKVADWNFMPQFPEQSEPTIAIGEAWSRTIAGEVSAKEALDEVQKRFYKLMREAGYYD